METLNNRTPEVIVVDEETSADFDDLKCFDNDFRDSFVDNFISRERILKLEKKTKRFIRK